MSCAYIADKSWYIKVPGLFQAYGIEYISLKSEILSWTVP